MKIYFVTTGGGLGNQIMSYALWLYFKKKGFQALLYLRINYLTRIFNIEKCLIKRNCYLGFIIYLLKQYGRIAKLFKRFFRAREVTEYSSFLGLNVIDYPEWRDYKFVKEILLELKGDLLFPKDNNEKNKRVIEMMRVSNSVSIHIRRGDYQNSIHWKIILGDVCDKQYYEDAVEKVYSFFPNPQFFIFSDDIDWVKANLTFNHPIFIDWNKGEDSFRDIQLMSYCKVNIIANSTFSLCAAWLNVNKDPIRIVPSKWLNSYSDNLLYKYIPSDWIIINNKKPTVSIIINSFITETSIKDILKQRYSDFELILSNNTSLKIVDDRIKIGEVKGRYIYEYSPCDSLKFRNRHYLWNWLSKIYNNELYG